MKSAFDRLKKLIKRIKYSFSRESCYKEMEKQRIAVFGMCGGLVGGDRYTNYLQYDCVDCPYYVGYKE